MRTLILAAVSILVGGMSWLFAQSPSGVLEGIVRDPSRLPVPDAEVHFENLERAFERAVRTGPDGTFRADALEPGDYRVTVVKSGFSRYQIARQELQIRQTVHLEIGLALGTARDVVHVEGAVTPLDAAPGSTGSAFAGPQIQALPLDVRNFVGLLQLSPGAIPRHLGGFVHDNYNDAQPGRGAVALNDPVNGARSSMNSYLLDGLTNTDGNTNALVVNPPLEAIQEFRLQSSVSPAEFGYAGGGVVNLVTRAGGAYLHAGVFEFFRNENLDAHTFYDVPDAANPPFRQNQYGAQLGGAVPGFSKLFFFAAYEGLRSSQANSRRIPAPGSALRQGNFAGLGPITDPQTGKPFANDLIPATRIDPIARDFLAKFQPFPNTSDGTYTDNTPDRRHTDTASLRLDRDSRWGNFFARYATNSDRAQLAGHYPVLPDLEDIRAQQAAIGNTYAGSRFVNDLRFGYTRLAIAELPVNAFRRDIIGELGITGVDRDPLNWGVPTFILASYQTVVDDPTLPQSQRDQTYQVAEGLTLQRGRHTLKFGGDLQRFQMNFLQRSNSRGTYNFSGAFTGNDFADFLLGLPQETTRTVGIPLAYLRRLSYSLYAQDEIRVRPGLTLNVGARYESTSPFTEKYKNFYNLDYSTLPATPALVRAGGKFGDSLVNADRNNFAPRVGLSWQLLPRLVFRGGYGIFYSPEIAVETYDLVRNGVLNEFNHVPANKPVLSIRNGFPSGASTGFPTYFGLDRNARTPYVQQWNGGWQAGVKSWLLQANYIGAKGTHLGRYRAFNTPAQVELGRNLAPRPGDVQSLRAFPTLGKLFQRQHIANSIYHSLELRVEHRFSGGLSFQGNFVWAKSIDDSDGVIPGLYDGAGAQDERNLRLERGLSFFDVRKRFTANLVYDLPFGKGRRFAAQGPLVPLVSGWQTSAIVLLQDGTPSNAFYFFTDYANSDTPNRPNIVPGKTLALPRGEQTIDRFFNTSVFSDPAPYTFGNGGRNILPGPGDAFFDLGIHRQFGLGETRNLEFRAEIFNLFNHPNWGIPGNNKDFGPYFGKINTVGSPRRIQLAIRFNL